ncbi:MAG: hypothetical protein FWH23_02805 [Bacteroidales bacterium]|nr:hypothetical protein [Bacteroidales bacterium]MCL2133515.1 hypothetical protein [Bacteroidales bacterium]
MEQKDYLLREIEKIGSITSALRQKIFGGKENLAITAEQQIKNAKGQLLSEINFDLDKFLDLNIDKSNEYILSFEGFSVENIEILAECFSEIGFSENCENSKKHLEKALQLYKLCSLKNKTYSFGRETNINAIKNALKLE